MAILNHLRQLKLDVAAPILIGPSRKSFIGRVLNLPVDERREGTTAAVCAGIMNGADIVRVHDVLPMIRVVRMLDAIKNAPAEGKFS